MAKASSDIDIGRLYPHLGKLLEQFRPKVPYGNEIKTLLEKHRLPTTDDAVALLHRNFQGMVDDFFRPSPKRGRRKTKRGRPEMRMQKAAMKSFLETWRELTERSDIPWRWDDNQSPALTFVHAAFELAGVKVSHHTIVAWYAQEGVRDKAAVDEGKAG